MVEAGLTDTSALTNVGAASPVSGSMTTDSASLLILLAFSACSTRGGSVWFTPAAWAGRVKGRAKMAKVMPRRMELIVRAPLGKHRGLLAV